MSMLGRINLNPNRSMMGKIKQQEGFWSNNNQVFGPLSFNVLSLFANGEQGCWLDFSDTSTLFQDSAGTIPAVLNSPVGKILDKSGRGNHFIQATAPARPILKQDAAGLYYLEWDGVDDAAASENPVNFTGTDSVSIFAGMTRSAGSTAILCELSTDLAANAGTFYLASDATGASEIGSRFRGTVIGALASSLVASPATRVVTGLGKISTDTNILRLNGVQVATTSSDQGTGNMGTFTLYLGARGGVSLFFNGKLYQLIIRGATCTAGEITSAEKFVGVKTGVPL